MIWIRYDVYWYVYWQSSVLLSIVSNISCFPSRDLMTTYLSTVDRLSDFCDNDGLLAILEMFAASWQQSYGTSLPWGLPKLAYHWMKFALTSLWMQRQQRKKAFQLILRRVFGVCDPRGLKYSFLIRFTFFTLWLVYLNK